MTQACPMFKFPHILLFAIIFTLVSVSFAPTVVNTQLGSSATINVKTNVHADSLAISSSSFPTGTTVDFTTTLTNIGNTVQNVSTTIYIRNSGGTLVDTVVYATITLAGGETTALTKSWDSSSQSPGVYTAYANATLSDGNITNTVSTTFVITAAGVITPPIGGGSSGGGKKIQIPIIGPLPDIPILPQLQLLRYLLYKEIEPGEKIIMLPLVKNPGDETVILAVNASGFAASFARAVEESFLASKEERSLLIPVEIPEVTNEGYYQLDINLQAGQSKLSHPFIAGVKKYTALEERPLVFREISLDLARNVVLVILTVKNKGTDTISHVELFDYISPDLAANIRDINFITAPSTIDEKTLLARWDFENIGPQESRNIIYELPAISGDFSDYVDWPIYQTAVITGKSPDPISISEFSTPTLFPGEQREVYLTLFNSGALTRRVRVSILSPDDWAISPLSTFITIGSRESKKIALTFNPSSAVQPGTYTFRVRLEYDGKIAEHLIFVTIAEPLIEVFPPPLHEQLIEWFQRNIQIIMSAAVILFVLLVILSTNRYRQRSNYDMERLKYANSIKKMVKKSG